MKIIAWIYLAAYAAAAAISILATIFKPLLLLGASISTLAFLITLVVLALACLNKLRPRELFFILSGYYPIIIVAGIVVHDNAAWVAAATWLMPLGHLILAIYGIKTFNDYQKMTAARESNPPLSQTSKRVLLCIAAVIAFGAWRIYNTSPFFLNMRMQHASIETLEQLVASANEMDIVPRREYAGAYFELGNRYLAQHRDSQAMTVFEQGLETRSLAYKYQIKLARLELAQGLVERAYYRLKAVTERGYDNGKQAEQLLSSAEFAGMDKKPLIHHILPGYTFYIAKFNGADDAIAQELRAKITDEFGFETVVLQQPLVPSDENSRTGGLGKQYNADALNSQLEQEYSQLLNNRTTLGVLGILPDGLYFRHTNFVFGQTGERHTGVISYAMFYNSFDGNPVPAQTGLKRTLTQAMSSVGLILGLPRCSIPRCARAYPESLAEHDLKHDTLCYICLENLGKLYATLPAPVK